MADDTDGLDEAVDAGSNVPADFVDACYPTVAGPLVGAIEQWADSTDVLSSPGRRAALQAAYRTWADPNAGDFE